MRIRCLYLSFTLTAIVALTTYGQAGQAEQTLKTSVPSDARFELIQSTLAAKFTGEVGQIHRGCLSAR